MNWKRTVWVTLIVSRLAAWYGVERFKLLEMAYRRKTSTVRMPAAARCFGSIAPIWPMGGGGKSRGQLAVGERAFFGG